MSRLLSILALLAVLLAPAGMLGSHAAMAMPQSAAASGGHQQHHSGGSGEEQRAMIDCAIACSAMPADQPLVGEKQFTPAPAPDPVPAIRLHGTRPEAATPPPRVS